MSYSIIRFPTAAKFDKEPMATPLTLRERFNRWLFGRERKRTWNSIKFDRIRRGR